jgi:16S rRNA (cytidine1402-2'-O)-methyltransferase
MKGKLFLFPTTLSDDTQDQVLPAGVRESIKNVEYFLCENVRTSRRFISSLKVHAAIEALRFEVLNKDTTAGQLPELLRPVMDGLDAGILSESGCPGIADPGAMAVAYAHENGIRVIPLVGPSSILMALMASGLNGQHFAFHGYLPIEGKEALQAIRNLERESRERKQTQIFIETPFRNNALMGHLLKSLRNDTRLCVAANITAKDEWISCLTVEQWKLQAPHFDKIPAVFLFQAAF